MYGPVSYRFKETEKSASKIIPKVNYVTVETVHVEPTSEGGFFSPEIVGSRFKQVDPKHAKAKQDDDEDEGDDENEDEDEHEAGDEAGDKAEDESENEVEDEPEEANAGSDEAKHNFE